MVVSREIEKYIVYKYWSKVDIWRMLAQQGDVANQ